MAAASSSRSFRQRTTHLSTPAGFRIHLAQKLRVLSGGIGVVALARGMWMSCRPKGCGCPVGQGGNLASRVGHAHSWPASVRETSAELSMRWWPIHQFPAKMMATTAAAYPIHCSYRISCRNMNLDKNSLRLASYMTSLRSTHPPIHGRRYVVFVSPTLPVFEASNCISGALGTSWIWPWSSFASSLLAKK